jgi:hypothetical protein
VRPSPETAAAAAVQIAVVGMTVPLTFYLRDGQDYGAFDTALLIAPFLIGLATMTTLLRSRTPSGLGDHLPMLGLTVCAVAAISAAILLHNAWNAPALALLLALFGVGTATCLSRPRIAVPPLMAPPLTAITVLVILGASWAAGAAADSAREGVSAAFWLSGFSLLGGLALAVAGRPAWRGGRARTSPEDGRR